MLSFLDGFISSRRGGRGLGALLVVVAGLAVSAAACDSPPSAADIDRESKMNSYEQLQRQQPADQMDYSPARNTINEWIKSWEEPGKLSYVYLYSESGVPLGYYIFEGLPVSYCTSLTPTVRPEWSSGSGALLIPLPGVDGTYSSGSGCDQYFGKEAESGTILEFGGGGISYLLSEHPLPVPHQPLGISVSQVQAGG